MFQQLRDRFSEAADKLWTLGDDDDDKQIAELVARGTGDDLIAPDWGVNMSIVDTVNSVNQNTDPSIMYDKLCKALRRCISRNSAKSQMLSLTILETCVKNCYPAIYAVLAHSDLWLDLMKMAADMSVGRIDAEVRDKILSMSEDYAKVLPPPEFREAYELLLEHGIDFPVRGPDEQPPILNPPPVPVPPPGSVRSQSVQAHGGYLRPLEPEAQQQLQQPEVDPFAGMSAEDQQAVRAAMAEMDLEEQAVRESTAQAASAILVQQVGQPQQQQQQQQGQQQGLQQERHPQAEVAGLQHAPPAVLAVPVTPPPDAWEDRVDPGPVLPDNFFEAMQVISNTTLLMNELLASEADPQELFVAELAEQCIKLRSKLEDIINSLVDETQLASALVHHEALQAAVCKYDEHLAKAVQGDVTAPPAVGLLQRPIEPPLRGVSSPTQMPPEAAAAGSNFTLYGDGEEDEDEGGLVKSSRAKGVEQAAEVPKFVPVAPKVSADKGLDLIDLDDVHLEGEEQSTAPLPLPEERKEPLPQEMELPVPEEEQGEQMARPPL